MKRQLGGDPAVVFCWFGEVGSAPAQLRNAMRVPHNSGSELRTE
jgi:hypothetical protein